MNTAAMLDAIERNIQDPSYSRDEVLLPMLNEALSFVAYQHPLSVLQESAIVETEVDTDQVEMPEDYHSFLFQAYNQTAAIPCRVCYTRKTLDRMYSEDVNANGRVESVLVEKNMLFYRRIPTTPETLKLDYYGHPPLLTDSEDSSPECLPHALHKRLLVHQVLSNVWSELEDGIDSKKNNTDFHYNLYNEGLAMLKTYMPDVARPRHYYPRKARFF